jgi:hypothetical protein
MPDPQIICPTCHTEIKPTESLAAPLIAETRRRSNSNSRRKSSAAAKPGSTKREGELAKARESLEDLGAGHRPAGALDVLSLKRAWTNSRPGCQKRNDFGFERCVRRMVLLLSSRLPRWSQATAQRAIRQK